MKRFIAIILTLATLFSAFALVAAADGLLVIAPNPNAGKTNDVIIHSFRTSNDPEDYLQFDVEGNTLKLSGMLMNPELKYLYVIYANEKKLIQLMHGSRFSAKFDLTDIKYAEIEFSVYTGKDLNSEFVSAYYGRDIVLEKRNGAWGFVLNRGVFESNEAYMSGWMDETKEILVEVPDRIKRAAETAVQGLESDYDKARAIHEYVANNLYYDKDYSEHKTPSTYVTAEEVFDKSIGVCEGFANLTVAMLRSIGIPAAFVEGYAFGLGSSTIDWDHADLTSSNHSWVEAFVDGKWIILDPTWDCKNVYENGKKTAMKTDFFRFFDVSLEMFSSTHFVIYRPNAFGKRGLSDWALEESQEAYRYGLITTDCLNAMPDAITRLEFCDLVINMLVVKLGKDVGKILADKNATVNSDAFVDTDYYNILAANALGIVNGKEGGKFDPEGTIKRQEAAAMLQRAAVNVLGVEKPNSAPIEFADENTFADWGRDAISFVSASADKNGRKVMGGKEAGRFAPNDLYTKEQSVLTILRLYTAY